MGGLGNQLFQYSLARSICDIYKFSFKVDLNWFNNPSNIHRPFFLDKFNISYDIADDDEILDLVSDFKVTSIKSFYQLLDLGEINNSSVSVSPFFVFLSST